MLKASRHITTRAVSFRIVSFLASAILLVGFQNCGQPTSFDGASSAPTAEQGLSGYQNRAFLIEGEGFTGCAHVMGDDNEIRAMYEQLFPGGNGFVRCPGVYKSTREMCRQAPPSIQSSSGALVTYNNVQIMLGYYTGTTRAVIDKDCAARGGLVTDASNNPL